MRFKGPATPLDIVHQYEMGQYMTPPGVANQMVDMIRSFEGPAHITDPSAGDGALLVAAGQRLYELGASDVLLEGIELDPALAASARAKLRESLPDARVDIKADDFLSADNPEVLPTAPGHLRVVIANPPYGWGREYDFFRRCDAVFPRGTQLVFLVPLAFIERVAGLGEVRPLPGRPLGVTTGHAIVRHLAGNQIRMRPTREQPPRSQRFPVLTGVKLYERGAGSPAQTETTMRTKPFSSDVPRAGWLPCLRTGDITSDGVEIGRLWVQYGIHLAHPKTLDRFRGPRLVVRRVPIWKGRTIGAAYLDDLVLCAGDVLIVRNPDDDAVVLKGLGVWLRSADAADLMHVRRPTLTMRSSFPKFSAKDLVAVVEQAPSNDLLRTLGQDKAAA